MLTPINVKAIKELGICRSPSPRGAWHPNYVIWLIIDALIMIMIIIMKIVMINIMLRFNNILMIMITKSDDRMTMMLIHAP